MKTSPIGLEQRRCIQLLSLLHVHGTMNPDTIYVPPRITRAVNTTKYKTVKYEDVKYRNSPYYKAAKLWDTLPNDIKDTGTILELKRLLKIYFSPFDEYYFEV